MEDNHDLVDIPGSISEAKQVKNPRHKITRYIDVLYAILQAEKIDESSYKHILTILEDTYALCRKHRILNSDEIKGYLQYVKNIVRQIEKKQQEAVPLTQTKLREYIHQTISAMRFMIRDLQDSEENPPRFQINVSTVLIFIAMVILLMHLFYKINKVNSRRRW